MAILDCDKVHITRQIMAIRVTTSIDIGYIQLVLETLVAGLKAAAKSMIPGIAREDVLRSLLPLPPVDEQKRIVQKMQEILHVIRLYGERLDVLDDLNTTFPDRPKKSIR